MIYPVSKSFMHNICIMGEASISPLYSQSWQKLCEHVIFHTNDYRHCPVRVPYDMMSASTAAVRQTHKAVHELGINNSIDGGKSARTDPVSEAPNALYQASKGTPSELRKGSSISTVHSLWWALLTSTNGCMPILRQVPAICALVIGSAEPRRNMQLDLDFVQKDPVLLT